VDEARGAVIQRGEMTLEHSDTGDPRWRFLKDKIFDGEKWVPVKMAETEELDTGTLDAMKTALDELKIVDVNPKPAGLSADLKAAKSFLDNRQAVASLMLRGFFLARLADQVQLVSNEGEIRVLMKDGVEYVLRFGEIAGSGASKKPDEKKEGANGKPEDDKEDESETAGVNRFIFVTTEFNPDVIEKPKFEPLPEEKPEPKPGAEPEAKPGAEKPEAKPEAKPEEKKQDALKAERDRIEKEKKRKQEEYDEKIEKGKKHVKELNDRFADWYYIIPDDVYRKIHLGRKDIVKKKEAKKEEGAGEGHEGHDHGEKPKPKPGDTPSDFEDLKEKAPKPAEPAPKPVEPAAKPTEPAPKPTEPAAKPVTPAPEPKPPAAKP